jgi:hypothetical protein
MTRAVVSRLDRPRANPAQAGDDAKPSGAAVKPH